MVGPAPSRVRGVVYCLASATAFGFAPAFAREATSTGLSVATMLSARFAIAACVFWFLVRLRGRRLPSARTLLSCAALGALGYALQSTLYFGALTRVDATIVALVLYVYPALVVGLAVVLGRERPDGRTLVALGISLAGLGLLLGAGSAGTGRMAGTGLAMAVGAAVAYALYITVSARLLEGADVFAMSAVICTAASASLAAAAAATGDLMVPAPGAWLWIALLALVGTVAAVGFFLAGVRAIGPSKASVLSCLEPVVTALTAVALYGEVLTPARLAGGAAVLAAVLVVQSRGVRVPGRSLDPQGEPGEAQVARAQGG